MAPVFWLAAAALDMCVHSAGACVPTGREKLESPRIDRKVAVASATRSPWIVANVSRYRMDPRGAFLLEPEAGGAVLAAAEAFAFGANALIRAQPEDAARLTEFKAFTTTLAALQVEDVADFQIVDNGSKLLPEVLNLLSRRNLLYSVSKTRQGKFPVEIGSREFPVSEARDPSAFAALLRDRLGDRRRSLRLYGTELTLARFQTGQGKARVQLVNYGRSMLEGIRVRVRGRYSKSSLRAFGYPDSKVEEIVSNGEFTEFSIPLMREYAVVDLE